MAPTICMKKCRNADRYFKKINTHLSRSFMKLHCLWNRWARINTTKSNLKWQLMGMWRNARLKNIVLERKLNSLPELNIFNERIYMFSQIVTNVIIHKVYKSRKWLSISRTELMWNSGTDCYVWNRYPGLTLCLTLNNKLFKYCFFICKVEVIIVCCSQGFGEEDGSKRTGRS